MTDQLAVPAGLSVTRLATGWVVAHAASRLPLHQHRFARTEDLALALADLAALGIDWRQPAKTLRRAVDSAAVQDILTPPEHREQARRVAANAERYLRALDADGHTVVASTSHGIAGTTYQLSCGCHRHYSVGVVGPDAGQPSEELLVRCHRHARLVVPAVSTDVDQIMRELWPGRPAARMRR
jgi:hypothetical protein